MRSAEPVTVIVFARAPRPGRTKTRLVPALGEAGAARLHAAMLEDVLATVASVPGLAVELWCPAEDVAALPGARAQRGEDLGARMTDALADALERAPRALLIGSDLPTLPAARLAEAVDALDAAEVVLGPSADGGFYLVGARGSAPPLGPGVRWSTRSALADTRARLGDRAVALVGPWYDVDTPEDLRLLRAHLALAPGAAPATAAALADFDRVPAA